MLRDLRSSVALLRDSSTECGVAQGLVRVSADRVYVDSLCGDFKNVLSLKSLH